ncbi:KAP family NTPase [Kribbella sp. NBC_00709]|uniref:KAP family P-loop NTPase fold protein n=1 Tax=Kribbella sp. NBC_00709 TaxID=2975972 RepID=UPI002E2AE718|nr:P-loop NTPase fold protein [Kribbella sp. NBC_00709]
MSSRGDNPIKNAEQDRLQRREGARSVAADIRELDASEGYVVGVVGPWGSGKTSIVNMIRESLEVAPAVPIVEFNPWIFSGTDELVESFFRELSAQMRLKEPKVAAIADAVDTYGDLLSPASAIPIVGAWFDRVRGSAKALKAYQERRKGSVAQQRDKLAKELNQLTVPIVVIIDDIDRLESSEIRDIFKLVRLTASFPNVVYLLAFDRARVEDALSQSGFDGRAYLEKIVQLGVDVPVIADSSMLRVLGESLDEALGGLDATARFDADAWPDVLMEIIRPLITNLRDVNRFAAAVRAKARTLGSQIELADLMGLEAIRVFLPDVFSAIVAGRDALTATSPGFDSSHNDPVLKAQVESIIAAGGSHPDVVRAALVRLFPAARRHLDNNNYGSSWLPAWLKARRVAHPDVLAMYLEHTTNEGLKAFNAAEQAFEVLDDEASLDALLRSFDVAALEDVIAALQAFEADFPTTAVVSASRVLLNLLPELPDRPQGMFGFINARVVVARVVLRLLRRLDTPEQVMAATEDVLAGVSSLSSRFEIVTLVGHREGAGQKLVSEADSKSLENKLRLQIEAATPEQLAQERDLLRLLYLPKRYDGGQVVHADAGNSTLAKAVLLNSQSVVRSQAMGNRAVHRTTRLNWDMLVEIFGGEDEVERALDTVRASADEDLTSVIELADKYLKGWRPSDWGDD